MHLLISEWFSVLVGEDLSNRKMKRTNSDILFSISKKRSTHLLILLLLLCIMSVIFDVSFVFKTGFISLPRQQLSFASSKRILQSRDSPNRPLHVKTKKLLSGLNLISAIAASRGEIGVADSANDAVELGRKLWEELELMELRNSSNGRFDDVTSMVGNKVDKVEDCPNSITVTGDEFGGKRKVVFLPCGLTVGSHITVVGKPRGAHEARKVSEFMLELQGLKTVEGEEAPRMLHFNPRLRGDWSGKPAIEHNTCYRMQWGMSQRCQGWRSPPHENTVDGFVKCEKWIRDDDDISDEPKTTWWLNRLIERTKKVSIDWPFPFQEEKLFVLTLHTGLEGYHVFVDGRHLTSFPYRTGFTLEDATGLSINGDVDVHSVFAASLPTSHPNFAPKKHLDFSDQWKAPPIPDGPVELFIGVLSSGNHFAERMAVRKSWMQYDLIKSSNVVARFFVALHGRKEVNEDVKEEAEFFGDIVIVPYMDSYDLVVLKTVAICEYGVRTVSAKYIMKGDDDTFVRVDAIIDETKRVQSDRSLYIGNINYYHKPLRSGKWAVTFEEWPEEVYPPYANGAGYIISSDIANAILSDFDKHRLRLFKMEDVSMGMWVEKHNMTRPVEYVHSLRFCQFGCVQDYITAHYQSPRQMICLWNKLRRKGRPLCCNMR